MKELILIGGGGHCKSCIDIIEQQSEYNIVGILDKTDKRGQKVFDYEIIGTDEDIDKYVSLEYEFLITLGQIKTSNIRKMLFKKIKSLGGKLATIISPNAYISKHSSIEEGTIIMNGVIINANSKIGKNCTINSKALIEHDCIIGDNCHISISAVIAGGVKIESDSFIGANATIVQGINVPSESFIKAGSLVK